MYGLAVRGDGLATYIDSAFVIGAEPVEVVLDGPRGKRSSFLYNPKLITWGESTYIDLNSPTTDLSSFEGAVEETIKELCPDQTDTNVDFLLHEGKGTAFKDDFLVYRITSSTYDCLSGLDGRRVGGVDLLQQIGETLIFSAISAGIASSSSVFAPLVVKALTVYSHYDDTKFITSFAKDFLEGIYARHIQVLLLGELPEGKIVPGNQYTPLVMVKNNQSADGNEFNGTIPLHIRFEYKYNETGDVRLLGPSAYSPSFDFGDFPVKNNNAYIIIPARNVSFEVVDQKGDYVLKDREIELFIDFPESLLDASWFLDLIFWNYKTALSIADFYPRFTASVEGGHLVLDASHSILSSEKKWATYKWSYTLDNEKQSLSNKLGSKLTVPLSELYDLVGDTDSLDVILDLAVSWDELFGWIQKRDTKTVSKRVAIKGVEEPEVPTPPDTPPGELATGTERAFSLPGDVSMAFVWIEPGVFQMGSPESEEGRLGREGPLHEVEISRGFWLGKYEVTQGEWEAVMGETPWSGVDEDYVRENSSHPAVYILWSDVQEFIEKLNASAGSDVYRLPTEAEWEYACRAGTQTRWSFGDDESELTDYAWYADNAWDVGKGYAQPVGLKRANPWGLYDMHGNVFESVQDSYGEDYYNSSPRLDPPGPDSGLL